jgi:ferrous iron transport protein B
MGITTDNWPAAVGIFTGVLAKEAVVGTLDSLYSGLAASDAGAVSGEDADFDLWASVKEAFATVPDNLAAAFAAFSDPLGLDIGDVTSAEAAGEEQEVNSGTFGAMAARFDGAVGAFAYLLLVLLYMPCAASIAAVARETNWKWTAFICSWTTLIGYSASVLFYQTARFGRDPTASAFWIVATVIVILAVLGVMRYVGSRQDVPQAVMVPGT